MPTSKQKCEEAKRTSDQAFQHYRAIAKEMYRKVITGQQPEKGQKEPTDLGDSGGRYAARGRCGDDSH